MTIKMELEGVSITYTHERHGTTYGIRLELRQDWTKEDYSRMIVDEIVATLRQFAEDRGFEFLPEPLPTIEGVDS